MSNEVVVFDRKQGFIGVKRLATEKETKEHGMNYSVDILDPINLMRIEKTVEAFGGDTYDWQPLSRKDPRTQLIMLFSIIEDRKITRWFFSGWERNEDFNVEEAYVENRTEVFEKIRKLFK